jgi:NTP pyrophosphatase (non-canonical NTP hydrolase)
MVGEELSTFDFAQLGVEVNRWATRNFGADRPSNSILLGVMEELGELSHAYLKREQGIRTTEDHDAAIVDAVADIVIYLADFCAVEGIDLQHAVEETWGKVKLRDWKKNPEGPDADEGV